MKRSRLLLAGALIAAVVLLSACQDPTASNLLPSAGEWDTATWDAATWE